MRHVLAILALLVCHARAETVWRHDFRHNTAAMRIATDVRITGHARGAGHYTGDGRITFDGHFSPGNSPAIVSIAPQVVFTPSNILTMEIGGLTPGPGTPTDNGYDKLIFTHAAAPQVTWGGTLAITLINGFTPAAGDAFDVFDFNAALDAGTFATITVPALPQYLAWNTSALYATGTISVQSTLTPIEQWRLLHFGTPANSGAGADHNDFDKDGAKNLLEYALGLDPLVPSASGLPALSVVTAGPNLHIALTIIRPLSATDITYQIEVGGALVSFLPGSSYSAGGDVPTNANTTQVSRTPDGLGNETLVIRDNTARTAATSRFLRLKVSNP